jgi:hypothetical protein
MQGAPVNAESAFQPALPPRAGTLPPRPWRIRQPTHSRRARHNYDSREAAGPKRFVLQFVCPTEVPTAASASDREGADPFLRRQPRRNRSAHPSRSTSDLTFPYRPITFRQPKQVRPEGEDAPFPASTAASLPAPSPRVGPSSRDSRITTAGTEAGGPALATHDGRHPAGWAPSPARPTLPRRPYYSRRAGFGPIDAATAIRPPGPELNPTAELRAGWPRIQHDSQGDGGSAPSSLRQPSGGRVGPLSSRQPRLNRPPPPPPLSPHSTCVRRVRIGERRR